MQISTMKECVCLGGGGPFVFPIRCHTMKATFFPLQNKVVCLSQCDLWFAKILKRSLNKSSDYVLLFIPMAVCVCLERCVATLPLHSFSHTPIHLTSLYGN